MNEQRAAFRHDANFAAGGVSIWDERLECCRQVV